MSFASVTVLTACLLIMGVASLLMITVNNFINYAEDQNEMVLFLKDNLNKDQILNIKKNLENIDNIASIKFVPKDISLQEQLKMLGDDNTILDELKKDNPLPDIYVISLKNLATIDQDLKQLKSINNIYKINAPIDIAKAFTNIKNILIISGIGISCILLIISMVIITNTIKVTIFNRKKEINIMKFVGATDAFIKLPFIIEGIFLGIIAAGISFGIICLGYNYLLKVVDDFTFGLIKTVIKNALLFENLYIYILSGYLILGIGVGSLSSAIFVKKYLKV
jgi:cell division transport system permease protein